MDLSFTDVHNKIPPRSSILGLVQAWVAAGPDPNEVIDEFVYDGIGFVKAPLLGHLFTNLAQHNVKALQVGQDQLADRVAAARFLLDHGARVDAMVEYTRAIPTRTTCLSVFLFACCQVACPWQVALLEVLLPHTAFGDPVHQSVTKFDTGTRDNYNVSALGLLWECFDFDMGPPLPTNYWSKYGDRARDAAIVLLLRHGAPVDGTSLPTSLQDFVRDNLE